MLTDLEIERLREPSKTKLSLLRYSHFVIRNKLKTWLEAVEDVKFILDKLEIRQLSKIVDNKAVFSILDLSESMLAIARMPAIIEGEYVRVGVVPKNELLRRKKLPTTLKNFEYVVRRASSEEKERVDQLKAHIIELSSYLGEDDLIEVIDDILDDTAYPYYLVRGHPTQPQKKDNSDS